MRATLAFLLILLALGPLAGCDEDEDQGRRTTRFSGHLVFTEDESPLPDLAVTLFEPDTQTAVARTVSDAEGYFEFSDFPPGSYVPVVHANGYRPVFLPRPRWRFEEGDRFDVTLRLRRTPLMPETNTENRTLTCRVVEQGSDPVVPIENARAEMNFGALGELSYVNWSEYVGWSNTLEATSDADGMLVLEPVQLIYVIGGGSIIPEFRVSAPGYRSRVIPQNDDPATAFVSVIGVRLVPGVDEGKISGVVTDPQGQPLANVPVSAEWRRVEDIFAPRSFEKDGFAPPQDLLIPDGVAWTDENGAYTITGLPEGHYNVLAGPYPDDGFVGYMLRGVQIAGYAGEGVADLAGFVALDAVSPDDGAVFEALPSRIEWEPVDGAATYVLTIIRDYDGQSFLKNLTTPFFDVQPGANFFKLGQSFAWAVEAYDDQGAGLSASDRPYVFHVMQLPQPD